MPDPRPTDPRARTPRRRLLCLLAPLLLTFLAACSAPPTIVPVQATPTAFPAPSGTATVAPPAPTTSAAAIATPRLPTATRTPAPPRPTTSAANGGPTPTGVALTQATFARVGLQDQSLTTMVVGGKDGQMLFVGGAGVYRSTDAGKTWTPVRTVEQVPRVTTIVLASENPQVVYVGASDGCEKIKKRPGYASKDGGATWRAIGDNLLSIALDPKDSQRVFATTCEGLQRSEDGGGTWEPIPVERATRFAEAILVHGPVGTKFLYLASVSEKGAIQLLRSRNEGATWDVLALGRELSGLISLMLDPADSRVLLLSTSQGLYRSINGGQDWEALADGLEATEPRFPPTAAPDNYRLTSVLAANPDHSGNFWVGTGSGKTKGIGVFRTVDNGATWRKVATGLEGRIIRSLAVGGVPDKRILYVATDDGLWSIAVH